MTFVPHPVGSASKMTGLRGAFAFRAMCCNHIEMFGG